MTRPTLTVVGKGEIAADAPDDAAIAHAEQIAADLIGSVKAGFGFWIMLDGDIPKANFGGNPLEMAALAEEIARDMKCAALGLDE
jgi:hypothetical protein